MEDLKEVAVFFLKPTLQFLPSLEVRMPIKEQ